MTKKFLIGTAIAVVLATASHAQTSPSEFYTPDGRFAVAHGKYDSAKNDQCRTPEVESAIASLDADIEWMSNWIQEMGTLLNSLALLDPTNEHTQTLLKLRDQENALLKKAKFEKGQMDAWLANLKSKPTCPTPDAPAPAITGGGNGQQPAGGNTRQPPPQGAQPQPPEDDDPEPPGTCFTTANAVAGLLRLKLDPRAVLQQDPPPRWKQQTIGDKCVWYLKYYTINDRGEKGWNILYTEVPCTDPPPESSAQKDPGSDGRVGGQYCPPPSSARLSRSGDVMQSQMERSTPTDPIATPLQLWWLDSVTHLGASGHLSDKSDTAGEQPAQSDPKTVRQLPKAEDKTSKNSRSGAPNKPSETARSADQKSQSTERQSDSKPNDKSEKSDSKFIGSSEHSNAKSARTIERANAKSENSSEHAARTVPHERPEVSHHVAHMTEAGHMTGMREAGMHMGGLAGTHPGGLGALGSMHLGGFGGMHIGGFGRL